LYGDGAYTGGTFSALPAGLFLDATTGDITPGLSTAGTYTVTYTLPAAGGCGIVTASTSVTVTELPTASISYAGNPFCNTVSTPQPVTLTGTGGYTGGSFSAGAGLTLNTVTGEITPGTSTPGTYTVTYTIPAAGACGIVTTTTSVTISVPPAASISYAGTPFCTSISTPQPVTLTGTGAYTGGTFTSPAGLTLDAVTGDITPGTSIAGTYTVTYSVITLTGCGTITATTSVTVSALPTASISYAGNPFCDNISTPQPVTLTGTGAYLGGSYSAGAGLTLNTVTGEITPSTSTLGTYTVTYTIPAAGACGIVTTTTSVTISAPPTASISYAGTPFCTSISTPQPVTLTGTGAYTGGTFTSSAGLTLNTVTGDITPNTSIAGTYTVTYSVIAPAGCGTVTATASVTITALPAATIAYAGTPFCNSVSAPQSVTLTGTGAYLGGTYAAGAGLTLDAVTGDITPNTSTPGTYTVTYTIPASGGCGIITTTTSVTVTALPTASISYAGTPFCLSLMTPQPVTLTGTDAYTGGTYSAPSGLSINPVTGAITPGTSTAGTYTVTYTIPASGGCGTVQVTTSVTINPLPVPTLTGPNQVCVNTAGNVYTTQSGMTNYTWTVSSGGVISAGGNSGSNTVTITWNTVGAGFVSVNYTDANGCTAMSPTTYIVTVNPRPVPAITGPTSACVGSAGNVYTTQSGMTNYSWVVSAGGNITGGGGTNSNTVTVTWNTTGAQSVSVNYDNGSGCPALNPTVYNVTVYALPVPTITGPGQVCAGTPGSVYTTQAGMSNYTWSVSAGGNITAGGGTGSNTVTVTWTTAGPQTVSVNYTNSNGCSAAAPAVFNVTVLSVSVPTITGQTSMCVNSGYYDYTTEAGMLNYSWTVSSGGVINNGSGTNQIQVSWVAGGAQTVTVTYNNGGCTSVPTTLNVNVTPTPDQAGPITGTSIVCAGASGVAYSVAPILNTITYIWTLPPNAIIASGTGTNSITVDYASNAASGDIFVFGNNTCGDGGSSPAFSVTVNPLPDPAGTISGPSDICAPESGVVYSVPPVNNATGYIWTVPSGVIVVAGSNTNAITVNFPVTAASGNFTVQGTNYCGNGPVSPDYMVTVNLIPPAPVITANGDTLHSNAPAGNQWYFEGSLIVGATSQTYVATQTGHYWDVVDLNGCSSDTSNHKYVIITGIGPHPATSINLYPVPNSGRFNIAITAAEESFSFRIYNNLGVMIYDQEKVEVNGSVTKVVDIRPVPGGLYTVIITGDRETIVKQIVIDN
jgi:hypothetical protein